MSNVVKVSWAEVDEMSQKLSVIIPQPEQGILAVARGGLIPATILANLWDTRDIKVVSVIGYVKQRKLKEPQVGYIPRFVTKCQGDGWLVVDDIYDSGDTYRSLRYQLPRAKFACLVTKQPNNNITHISTVARDQWVVFPWEA